MSARPSQRTNKRLFLSLPRYSSFLRDFGTDECSAWCVQAQRLKIRASPRSSSTSHESQILAFDYAREPRAQQQFHPPPPQTCKTLTSCTCGTESANGLRPEPRVRADRQVAQPRVHAHARDDAAQLGSLVDLNTYVVVAARGMHSWRRRRRLRLARHRRVRPPRRRRHLRHRQSLLTSDCADPGRVNQPATPSAVAGV